MSRPLRPCGAPGCPMLVERGNCPQHTRVREKDPEQAKYYGSARWQAIRRVVRAQEPICRECRRAPSAVVDHIDGNFRNDVRENLRALCRECNATITGKQHRAKRKQKPA